MRVTRVAVIASFCAGRAVATSAAIWAYWMAIPANGRKTLGTTLFGWKFYVHLSERDHSTLTLAPLNAAVQCRKVGTNIASMLQKQSGETESPAASRYRRPTGDYG